MTRLLTVCAALALVGVVGAQTPATQRPDPKNVRLRGGRFKPLTYEAMTPAQRTMIEHVLSGPRGRTRWSIQRPAPQPGDGRPGAAVWRIDALRHDRAAKAL